MESRDGVVVRVLTSHQCGLGLIPKLSFICGCQLSLMLVLALDPRVLSPGPVFSFLLSKTTFLNSNLIRNLRATGLLSSVTLVNQGGWLFCNVSLYTQHVYGCPSNLKASSLGREEGGGIENLQRCLSNLNTVKPLSATTSLKQPL